MTTLTIGAKVVAVNSDDLEVIQAKPGSTSDEPRWRARAELFASQHQHAFFLAVLAPAVLEADEQALLTVQDTLPAGTPVLEFSSMKDALAAIVTFRVRDPCCLGRNQCSQMASGFHNRYSGCPGMTLPTLNCLRLACVLITSA